jgi:hypothetical protein
MTDRKFRAGDHVRHEPSGEEWVLACDMQGDEVIPAGWPESFAKAGDCTVIREATDTERIDMLRQASESRTDYGQTTRRSRLAYWQLHGKPQE